MQLNKSDPIFAEALNEFKKEYAQSLKNLTGLIRSLKNDEKYYESLSSRFI